MIATKTIGRWLTWTTLLLVVVSVCVWFLRWDRVPWTIRVATGESGGLYHDLGESLEASLSRRLGRKVRLLETTGSVENFSLLTSGEADLAIIQGGSAELEDAAVVTPLYPEWMVIIARRDRKIETVFDLVDRRVAIGKPGSGMRESARIVLSRLNIGLDEIQPVDAYFKALATDESVDAAFVTTGVANPDLQELLATRQFDIIPIADSGAIELLEPYFHEVTIPEGVFGERPPIPSTEMKSVATTAFLVAKPDCSDRLVEAALASIHEENLKLKVSNLIHRQEAPQWVATQMHDASKRYFNPADELGLMANVMESLAAGKELLFALGAGVYLLWRRWRLLRDRETQAMISEQKEHLDVLLERTLEIESAQATESDLDKLRGFLDDVTTIKLEALREFTEEELRADQAFQIFLDQCANLISKLQLKIISLRGQTDDE